MVESLEQPALFGFDYTPLGPESLGRARISEIDARQILTKPGGSLKGFDYSLNPYIGCGFACSYCYAAFFQPDKERFDTWGTWIEIKKNAEELLKKKRDLRDSKMIMSSATDPYQPLEAKVELTRRLVEIMANPLRQPRLTVQTRSPLVTRDIDLFKRFQTLRVNMSITTDSEAIRKQFEPSCASIERRMEAIAEAKAAGLRTAVSICPMLPIEDPEKFALKLKSLKADHYYTGFFHSSDRPFAASTRPDALKLAERLGYSKTAYQKTVGVLQSHLPQLNEPRKGTGRASA